LKASFEGYEALPHQVEKQWIFGLFFVSLLSLRFDSNILFLSFFLALLQRHGLLFWWQFLVPLVSLATSLQGGGGSTSADVNRVIRSLGSLTLWLSYLSTVSVTMSGVYIRLLALFRVVLFLSTALSHEIFC
jgi:hypothetical protein